MKYLLRQERCSEAGFALLTLEISLDFLAHTMHLTVCSMAV